MSDSDQTPFEAALDQYFKEFPFHCPECWLFLWNGDRQEYEKTCPECDWPMPDVEVIRERQ